MDLSNFDITKFQDFNIPSLPLDMIIMAIAALAAYGAIRRGLLRELLICVVNIPYIAIIFYLFNELVQNEMSVDSFFYKISCLGAFYIAYLILVWFVGKSLSFTDLNPIRIIFSKILAAAVSILRTGYFIMACLVFFNLHIQDKKVLEKSDILMAMEPYAEEVQDYLLENDFLDNEITLYEDSSSNKFTDGEAFVNPLLSKFKESDTYQDFEKNIELEKLRSQIEQQLKSKL